MKDKTSNISTDDHYTFGWFMILVCFGNKEDFYPPKDIKLKMEVFVNELLDSVQLPSAQAIMKFPGYSKLESDEAKGNNPADQAAKTAALSSTETKKLLANIDYFPKKI